MKYMGLLFSVLFAVSSFGATAPYGDGTFKGDGYWKDKKGGTGTYEVTLTISGNTFKQKLVFDNGEEMEDSGEIKLDKNGFYEVSKTLRDHHKGSHNKVVARGYCGSVWCHTGAVSPKGKFEETIVFMEDKIYALGSVVMPKHPKTMWEHELTKQ